MAYIIFVNGEDRAYKIAANDSDKDNLNFVAEHCTVKSVSDADFNKIRLNQAWASLSGDTITYNDSVFSGFKSADELSSYLNNVKSLATPFVNANPSHPKKTEVENYISVINGIDTSSIVPDADTPLEKTWEQYCQDNGITFLHPLQIP